MKQALVLVAENGRTRTSTQDEFLSWVKSITAEEALAVDTETTGLGWNDTVRLVQFGTSERGYAVDARTEEGRTLVAAALNIYRGPLIFHNAKFDIRKLVQLGMDLDQLWMRALDTHVLAHVLRPDRMSFKLKMLAKAVLGDDSADAEAELNKVFKSKRGKKRGWNKATAPLLVLCPYAIQDTELAHRLYTNFRPQLTEDDWKVVHKEMSVLSECAVPVEWRGMRLDLDYALNKRDEDERKLDEYRRYFLETYGVDNPNADAQLIKALKAQGWEPTKFTPKAGTPQFDQEVLLELVDDYDLVRNLLEYRHVNKWLAAYVVNCIEQVDEDGMVHASYKSLGTKTSRMSCANPPLQQLPKGGGGEIRRLFIASPGNVIASVDYSAIEFRLAGAFSGDRRVIDVYAAGGDWYQQVADDLGITRPEAKIFCLAILYGAQGKRIGAALHISPAAGQRLVNGFWAKYPTLDRWVRECQEIAASGGRLTSKWGRTLRPHAPYAAANAVIQGTAAEVLKEGLLRLRDEGLIKYVCAMVHDEVVLDVPIAEAEAITAKVVAVLEDRSFACPLVAEGTVYGPSWGDGYAA